MGRLSEHRYSSYWYLGQPKLRPAFLDLNTALEEAGGLTDTPAGRRSYDSITYNLLPLIDPLASTEDYGMRTRWVG
ncbi:MAG: hypothetical protein IPL39_05350 [Opitutaceae bacterium]|nr:hypothetical protein [Opitutaceae bacterium]